MNQIADDAIDAAPPTTNRPPELLELPDGFALRRRTVEHADEVNAVINRNLEHLRPWMSWALVAPALSRTEEMTRLGWQLWEDGSDFLYVLEQSERPGSVLGMFGLHRRVGPGAIEIGYWIDEAHTGRSLATNGAAALTAAALGLADIERVEIHCDEANAASAAVPRKLGYRLDRIAEVPPQAPAETGRKLIWIQQRAAC
ncbi:GNAT family N-acetyltransferase [Kitasatospora kifunensis]|uniref:RimJ/RimL family protein N-acetyltransferase n=1 Tax=Kitasatospora kifunensis TaxID=58351 RepID=A0A7W7R002_KITKI|nr:GNAT family N-acetyltransferase [Kitasatospora kifunensis]MBB4922658.1 RimJ/RimL family protein N-acetyltransferase [Kitasatospora kifunensis]